MSLKSPIHGTSTTTSSNNSTTGNTSTSNNTTPIKPLEQVQQTTKSNVVVVIGQDQELENHIAQENNNVNSSKHLNTPQHQSISASNSPVNIRSPISSALPPININNRQRGQSNAVPYSSASSNNLNQQKPLPKPPGYLQKLSASPPSSNNGNGKLSSPGSGGKKIDLNNLPTNILQKTLSEGDITMLNQQLEESSKITNSNSSSDGVQKSANTVLNQNQQQSPPLDDQNSQSQQQPKRRVKSNSITELQRTTRFDKFTFPPLPPTPQSLINPGITPKERDLTSSGSQSNLPPLPPTPFNNNNNNNNNNNYSVGIPIVVSQSFSPSYIPTSPPIQATPLSSSTSSTSSLQILSISNCNSPIANSTSSPNLHVMDHDNNSSSSGSIQHSHSHGNTPSSGSNMSLTNNQGKKKSHDFKLKYFTQPTRCQLCSQFIWSVIGKQGYICNECGYSVHKLCCPKIIDSCSISPPKRKSNENIPSILIDQQTQQKPQQPQQSDNNNNNNIENNNISTNNNTTNNNNNIDNNIGNSNNSSYINNSTSIENIDEQCTDPTLSKNNLNNSSSNAFMAPPSTTLTNSNSNGNLNGLVNSPNQVSQSPNNNNSSPFNNNNNSKKRNSIENSIKDFHNCFKSLIPPDETLLISYSCGYQGSVVLKHGKLYISENYLCFYDSLVFDKNKSTRQKVIPFSNIKSIEKKSGLAPNGILVKTEGRDYQFCLLLHRDEVFEILEALLLHQEKLLLSESINHKNLDGIKQVLNQQKSRISVHNPKQNRRSKSIDNSILTLERISGQFDEPPLIRVIKSNDIDMIQLLLEYYNSNKSDEINQCDNKGYTPLHVAVSSENILDTIVLQLLKTPNLKVSVRNMDGNTALHYFCQRFRSPECQKVAQVMIEKGADVNAQNNNGETPLHKAIFNHSVRLLMVYVLLKNNANVNIITIAGESPLHYAVRLGRLDVLKILITAGADPTLLSTKEKKTPLTLAEEINQPDIVDLLRRLEIIINSLTMSNLLQYRMALILEEIAQEGSLSRLDETMMTAIGCYDEEHKKLLYALKNKKILVTGPPAVTAGAIDLLKELENMDVKNGKWIISQQDLEYTDKIGSGISGKVYKGLYRGREVAIKVLKSADEAHNREEFLKEFNVLASLQSSLIVGLYGVVLEPRICLVMEYCQKGSLYQVLHQEKFTWDRFFSVSHQLLKGISCLHLSQPQIVHRDVKTLNFLVSKDYRIKVADFGLSRFNTKSNQMTLNKTRGTSAYCAPEVFQGQEYSEKSDVYSLGVVFWELVYSVINQRYLHPYGEYKNLNEFQIMLYTANHNLRPTIPPTCPQSLRSLISSCWDRDPTNRPTCSQAIVILTQAEKEFTSSQGSWDELIRIRDSKSMEDTFSSSSSE
ncbi:ankyrin repeat-containing protein [Tieghemostelium lacteum]|uniref:non-specific serine/threonine protein kinase n=1 Tax=Tieghemostelium lacteum TaxID=361077 RepID=A0A151ZDL1_TIELA|nr:ankyrin repeat-containing protein [Tieghemostelium lacteum]|eukprot:KYQ92009.1 ankyrin repeat-containing protein [Tieghemostelium lacteum]